MDQPNPLNKPTSDVACPGSLVVEHQPHLLIMRVPGMILGWIVPDLFPFCQSFPSNSHFSYSDYFPFSFTKLQTLQNYKNLQCYNGSSMTSDI